LKELEDFEWFPQLWRQYQTDYIGFVVASFGIYKPVIQRFKSSGYDGATMFDLCSGSGEPALSIFNKSGRFRQLLLSDKFPHTLPSGSEQVRYLPESLDVLESPFVEGNTYTMFNAFHHFDDASKKRIINNIQSSGSSGFIVEILEPTPLSFLKVLFATTFGTLALTPFIKPFSLLRLFFTYIIPVNLITIPYDGLVSVCKSRSVQQYEKLFRDFQPGIHVSKIKNGLGSLIVIDIPKL
jgi:hypothetical protein